MTIACLVQEKSSLYGFRCQTEATIFRLHQSMSSTWNVLSCHTPPPSVRNTKQPSDLLCTFFQSPELFVQGTCLVGASESQKQNKSPRRSHSLGQLQMRSPGRTGSGTNAPSHFLPPFIYKQPSYWLLPCNNLALCTGVNHTSPKVCFNSSFK